MAPSICPYFATIMISQQHTTFTSIQVRDEISGTMRGKRIYQIQRTKLSYLGRHKMKSLFNFKDTLRYRYTKLYIIIM